MANPKRIVGEAKLSEAKFRERFDLSADCMIIATAQRLGMAAIAEGVETEQQRQLLLKNDSTDFQGYLFGRPVPIEQFEAMIKPG